MGRQDGRGGDGSSRERFFCAHASMEYAGGLAGVPSDGGGQRWVRAEFLKTAMAGSVCSGKRAVWQTESMPHRAIFFEIILTQCQNSDVLQVMTQCQNRMCRNWKRRLL